MQGEAFTYSDVLIKPRYSEIESRSKVSLRTDIGNAVLKLPVISSNMKTITGPKMAATMAQHKAMGILHRLCTVEENVEMFNEAVAILYKDGWPPRLSPEELLAKWRPVLDDVITDVKRPFPEIVESKPITLVHNIGVSVGVKDVDKERFDKLYEAGARIFCIDVAHGHHIHVKNMLNWINARLEPSLRQIITVIAGNIATPEAYQDLATWGADVVKVGIGPSPVCRTRFNTGVGVPQLYALESIYQESLTYNDAPYIIADGGISCVGDIAKALKYSDAVMLGSMIAGTAETPGDVFRNEHGDLYKVYGGSASGENKGENRYVEGVIKTVKFDGKVKYILREIEQGLQSAFSYVGVDNHSDYQFNCELVPISIGSHKESRI